MCVQMLRPINNLRFITWADETEGKAEGFQLLRVKDIGALKCLRLLPLRAGRQEALLSPILKNRLQGTLHRNPLDVKEHRAKYHKHRKDCRVE
jgi:hypothetical protein